MDRGFYSAAAGVLSQQKSFTTISNNIANAGTTGYKSQATVESSFGEHLVTRMKASGGAPNIGPGSFMTVNSSEYTDYSQGNLESTGRSVDLAIQGAGFFLIESDTYGEVATRNGQFEINDEGYLVLPGVGKVLNEGGSPIELESDKFTVTSEGVILDEEGDEIDTLYIATEREGTKLTHVGNGVYQSDNGFQQAEPEEYKILQGTIEKSNINMAQEMSKIIAGQNQYQSCTQILKIFDSINQMCVNQIGKIG
jgi:flagellar basal-body rod protein FlgF